MARETFLQNVRTASRFLNAALASADPTCDASQLGKQWQKTALWLTPKSVEGFNPNDFADLPLEQQEELRSAVDAFRAVTAAVPTDTPATEQQIQEAQAHWGRIVAVVKSLVRREWIVALEKLLQEAESWSRNRGWDVKRDTKRIADTFLGTYEVPRLLIHTLDGRLLLDPVTRYASGASGLVDLCVLPSYDSVMITRSNGHWYVQPPQADEARQPWSEGTFANTVTQLIQQA